LAGIYIHIPFCKQACYYCDFHFSTNQNSIDQLVTAINQELLIRKNYLEGETIETIYFGGGTPSLLNNYQLDLIFSTIDKNFSVESNAEITLEANPDDLTNKKLSALASSPINRLSIGIQSFEDEVLTYLNRAHNGKEAGQCVENARNLGFDNISLDLIYAIPGRDDNKWLKDLKKGLDFEPNHISSYCLTIEEKTVFGRWKDRGKLQTVDDEHAAKQFEILIKTLSENNYDQYEVSNFCKPGFESRHNSSYWRQEKYLGVGPSAHSYNKINRQFNISHNKKYLDALAADKIPYTLDKLSKEDHINDYLLTTLRTKWGADLLKLNEDYDFDLINENKKYIEFLIEGNKAIQTGDQLILTKEGFLFADEIASNLFIEQT